MLLHAILMRNYFVISFLLYFCIQPCRAQTGDKLTVQVSGVMSRYQMGPNSTQQFNYGGALSLGFEPGKLALGLDFSLMTRNYTDHFQSSGGTDVVQQNAFQIAALRFHFNRYVLKRVQHELSFGAIACFSELHQATVSLVNGNQVYHYDATEQVEKGLGLRLGAGIQYGYYLVPGLLRILTEVELSYFASQDFTDESGYYKNKQLNYMVPREILPWYAAFSVGLSYSIAADRFYRHY